MSCREFVELVTDYVLGALPPDNHARFEQHLDVCEGCRRYLGQMEATIRVVGRLRPTDLAPEAEQALLAAFRTWNASESPPV